MEARRSGRTHFMFIRASIPLLVNRLTEVGEDSSGINLNRLCGCGEHEMSKQKAEGGTRSNNEIFWRWLVVLVVVSLIGLTLWSGGPFGARVREAASAMILPIVFFVGGLVYGLIYPKNWPLGGRNEAAVGYGVGTFILVLNGLVTYLPDTGLADWGVRVDAQRTSAKRELSTAAKETYQDLDLRLETLDFLDESCPIPWSKMGTHVMGFHLLYLRADILQRLAMYESNPRFRFSRAKSSAAGAIEQSIRGLSEAPSEFEFRVRDAALALRIGADIEEKAQCVGISCSGRSSSDQAPWTGEGPHSMLGEDRFLADGERVWKKILGIQPAAIRDQVTVFSGYELGCASLYAFEHSKMYGTTDPHFSADNQRFEKVLCLRAIGAGALGTVVHELRSGRRPSLAFLEAAFSAYASAHSLRSEVEGGFGLDRDSSVEAMFAAAVYFQLGGDLSRLTSIQYGVKGDPAGELRAFFDQALMDIEANGEPAASDMLARASLDSISRAFPRALSIETRSRLSETPTDDSIVFSNPRIHSIRPFNSVKFAEYYFSLATAEVFLRRQQEKPGVPRAGEAWHDVLALIPDWLEADCNDAHRAVGIPCASDYFSGQSGRSIDDRIEQFKVK